jgi:hypothetical protein
MVLVSLAALVIFSLSSGGLKFREFLREDLFIFSEKSTIVQHILFQGILQLIIAGLFVLIILRRGRMRHPVAVLLTLVCLDLILASRLNGPYTVYYHHYTSKDIFNHSKQFPKGFPIPGDNKLIENRDQEKGMMYQALWRNLNIFYKEVSFEGYNPLHLKGFEEMADNHPETFAAMLENPLVFQASSLNPPDMMAANEEKGYFDPGSVYLDVADYLKLQGQGLRLSPGDQVRITGFSPVKVTVESISQGSVLVNLLQNRYHGWKATIDGKPAEIITVNLAFMAVVVPAGKHEVIFFYDPVDVRWGFYITLLALVAGVVVLRGTLQGL